MKEQFLNAGNKEALQIQVDEEEFIGIQNVTRGQELKWKIESL